MLFAATKRSLKSISMYDKELNRINYLSYRTSGPPRPQAPTASSTQQPSMHVSPPLPASTITLASTPLWQTSIGALSFRERVDLAYQRAQSVVWHYKLTADDVLHLTERYWRFHSDPILALDGSACVLLTIHYNLCLGTIATYLAQRPDLQPIVDKLVSFEWNGQYCLTELGHGLDIVNMETRATRLPDGSFELHTPSELAAKFMPPTSPSGYPCVSVIHARLIVDGEDRGPKVFLAQIHDGKTMKPGIISKVLSPRVSSPGVKHCLTYFNRVNLPASALLNGLEKSRSQREDFFRNISRVITGTLSMGVLGVTALRVASYVAASYSLRRRVIDSSTRLSRPIISFSTQYTPVLSAISQALVLRNFSDSCHTLFVQAEDVNTKHFIAAVMKATILRTAQVATMELGDRCGAQGLAEVNQITAVHVDLRGAAIAEGDILVISIRFAMDLLRGRLSVPPYHDPNSLLSRHEQSLILSLKSSLAEANKHRDGSVDTSVLPLCQALIEAIGARLAFEAACEHFPLEVLDLFIASTVRKDAPWYALNAGLDGPTQARMEAEAARALLPRINALMDLLEIEPYIVAPITSDQKWSRYVDSLDEYGGIPGVTSKL